MTYGPMPEAHRAAIKAGHARNRVGDSFLYLAICRDGVVKIGCAGNPERRLLGWGVRPKLLIRTKGGYPEETRLHGELGSHRLERGHDWYEPAVLSHPAVIAVFGDVPSMGGPA